jgi:hypothetical protein
MPGLRVHSVSRENLLEGIDAPKLGYQCRDCVQTPNATHFIIAKRP